MRVTLVTFGSRGDAEPFVALGERLVARGHQVSLVTHGMFSPMTVGTGIDTVAARGRSVQQLLEDPEGRELVRGVRNPLRAARRLASFIRPELEMLYEDTRAAVRDADVVVCSPATVPGMHAAESAGIPVVQAQLQPLVATRSFPAPVAWVGLRTLGPWGNRASYALDEVAVSLLLRGPVDHCRREVLGLPALGVGQALRQRRPDRGALIAVSPHVVPRPPDWPASVHLCGWWWRPPADPTPLDPATEQFLSAGEKPVLVTLGSMPLRDPAATTRLVVGAARDAGARLLLQRGWAGLGEGLASSADLHLIDDVDHDALLPRVRAVVHHGGAGTTGRSLLHGRPTLALPVLADQFFWGHRLRSLGVGPDPLPLGRLQRRRLADRLRALERDGSFSRRASTLGEKLRAEDGSGAAAGILESLMSRAS